MYQKEIYRFTEDIPSDAGYYNYYLFTKGKFAYLEIYSTRKVCVLCDENGEDILDDGGDRIFIDWNISYRDYPVWEDKLELYKTIEVAEEDEEEDEEEDYDSFIDAEELAEILTDFVPDSTVYLDVNDVLLNKHIEAFGEKNAVILMSYGIVKLIALKFPEEKEEAPKADSVDDLLNDIDELDSITINFNKND